MPNHSRSLAAIGLVTTFNRGGRPEMAHSRFMGSHCKLLFLNTENTEDTERFPSVQYRAHVERDLADGRAAGMSGTPSFALGTHRNDALVGVRIVGAQPYAAFESRINELLAPRPVN
jgi:hypothetical protein